MLTIGFATEFYTLWEVGEPYKNYVTQYDFFWKQDCQYLRNLSIDFEVAKTKVYGNYKIDLELRGESRFTRTLGNKETDLEVYQFSFGKLVGEDIRISNDVWQLDRAMSSERNTRTRAIAMRRLIELGEILKFKWNETRYAITYENGDYVQKNPYTVYHNYAPKAQVEAALKYEERKMNAKHHFNNGDKVTLEVELINSFSFDTQYGTTYINEFRDAEGRIFKYKGSNPPYFEDKNIKHQIKGTVEHSEYNSLKETRLKRIKVLG